MIRKQPFGSTGHMSSATLFGAAAFGKVTQAEADQSLDVLLEYGVNHIDAAASYGDAELRIGPWMKEHRKDFFLATKTGDRTYEGAKDSIHRSLDRLQTDQVDLIQMHNLVHPDDWDMAMGSGGALEALVEARDQGLVRFIGVTGHGLAAPAMHMRSLKHFDFNSVLFPVNYPMLQNERYWADAEALIAMCRERNVALQTIKSITQGPWATHERDRAVWYRPLEDQADIDRAVHFVLGIPDLFLNTAGDINLLPKVLDAANRYEKQTSDEEMQKMVERESMTPLFAGD